jgi:hypothetical protein
VARLEPLEVRARVDRVLLERDEKRLAAAIACSHVKGLREQRPKIRPLERRGLRDVGSIELEDRRLVGRVIHRNGRHALFFTEIGVSFKMRPIVALDPLGESAMRSMLRLA